MEDVRDGLDGLQRYAYALTGNRGAATALTLLSLEQLDNSSNADRKFAYETMSKIWAGPARGRLSELDSSIVTADVAMRPLLEVPEEARQAYALVAMENFSVDEASEITCVAKAQISNALIRAENCLAPKSGGTLIVEDEIFIAREIERTVKLLGHKVNSIEREEHAAILAAESEIPNIILSDIKLDNGGSGIQAVKHITRNAPVPTVFVTAYPDLVDGSGLEDTFVVSKPIDRDHMIANFTRAMFRSRARAARSSVSFIDRVVGARIRESRIAAGLSEAQCSTALGMTDQEFLLGEHGLIRISSSRLILLSTLLSVPITTFFSDLRSGKET